MPAEPTPDFERDPWKFAEPRAQECTPRRPACPACGGRLLEVRAKLQCSQCHRICENCCEGDRG